MTEGNRSASRPKFWSFALLKMLLVVGLAPEAVEAQSSGAQASGQAAGDRVRTVAESLEGAVGGVAADRMGNLFVADFRESVWKISPSGKASVFATGFYGASGNAIDSKGNLLQSSFFGHYVSRVDRHGDHQVIAEGFRGPVGIVVDPQDNFFVCNCGGNTISRVSAAGEVSVFAESPLFSCPNGITRSPDGMLYVVNFGDGRMLRIDPEGKVTVHATIPGGGNGHVTFAQGNLYATSFRGHRIFRVSLDGEVTLYAGTGAAGEANGPAAEATFTWPNGIAAGPRGDRIFVNDFLNRFPPTAEVPPQPLFSVRQITFASLGQRVIAALKSGGVEEMEAAYRGWKSEPATAGLFTETEINAVAYSLMGGGQLPAATRLFELNAESYPQSANAFDSLAESYMNGGRKKLAVENYEKSLALNPANTNAEAMIAKLRDQ